MADKPWKVMERKVAKFLGGKRNPLSGSNSLHTAGDMVHDSLYVECKYRARFAIVSEYLMARRMALREGKVPVLALQEKGSKSRYYVISENDLQTLINLVIEGR